MATLPKGICIRYVYSRVGGELGIAEISVAFDVFLFCNYLPTYLGIPFESGRENVYT